MCVFYITGIILWLKDALSDPPLGVAHSISLVLMSFDLHYMRYPDAFMGEA